MGDGRRVQRVEKELQHLVANYLQRSFRGRLRGLVTVSRVESNEKLRTAKIWVSVLGSDEDRDFSIEALQEGLHEIQQHINKQLRMRYVPRLAIELDRGLERMLRVESLLHEISKEQKIKNSNKDSAGEDE